MPDDFAKATAAPGLVTINGRDYRVGKYGPRDIGDLEAWLKSKVPDPRLMARELCADLSDAVAKEIWTELSAEAAHWPPGVNSRRGQELLVKTWDGHAMLLWVSLRRHNGNFTFEDAKALTKHDDEIAITVSNMSYPEPTFDPKAPEAVETG